ncbi:Aste57867_10977 [Aphanomyces stellatus]|uniref:Aste57867_10977 protein n=1 Tax=Aphanomyces stellatus TaxID=120398 RepID=A0A485KRP9_9STRA|nr:hypothetical protein As57867_010936 [Aphanomyces stellatus]VFT87845.1 Aste57867_10977 [Aphanomyces stellatus]
MARKNAKEITAAPKSTTPAETTTSASKQAGQDHVLVEICKNSEYIHHVRELAKTLEALFPHLEGHIECVHYEVPQWKVQLSWLCGILPFLGIVFLLGGEFILDFVGLPTENDTLSAMRENRIVSLLSMLVLGSLSQYLVTPAAFEVYFNDELVYSKIKASRWCTTEELLTSLREKGLKKKTN